MTRFLLVVVLAVLASKSGAQEKDTDARELLAKSKEFIKSREFSLSEATLTKALLACGDTKYDQIFKAELYLWFGRVREFQKNRDKKTDFWTDSASRASAKRILDSYGYPVTSVQRRASAIQREFYDILRKPQRKKN